MNKLRLMVALMVTISINAAMENKGAKKGDQNESKEKKQLQKQPAMMRQQSQAPLPTIHHETLLMSTQQLPEINQWAIIDALTKTLLEKKQSTIPQYKGLSKELMTFVLPIHHRLNGAVEASLARRLNDEEKGQKNGTRELIGHWEGFQNVNSPSAQKTTTLQKRAHKPQVAATQHIQPAASHEKKDGVKKVIQALPLAKKVSAANAPSAAAKDAHQNRVQVSANVSALNGDYCSWDDENNVKIEPAPESAPEPEDTSVIMPSGYTKFSKAKLPTE